MATKIQKTNVIGAGISLVDRFAHLEDDELQKLKEDAGEWYASEKVKHIDPATGAKKPDFKPAGIKSWFVWLSEKWYVRLLVGLVFTLVVLPWARRKSHTFQDELDEVGRREKRRPLRSRRMVVDGEGLYEDDRDDYDDYDDRRYRSRYDDDRYDDDDDDYDDDDDDDEDDYDERDRY